MFERPDLKNSTGGIVTQEDVLCPCLLFFKINFPEHEGSSGSCQVKCQPGKSHAQVKAGQMRKKTVLGVRVG